MLTDITCADSLSFQYRAARFCNGAAHGGQVVGSASIVPSLLQAWGCDLSPPGVEPGVTDPQPGSLREGPAVLTGHTHDGAVIAGRSCCPERQ